MTNDYAANCILCFSHCSTPDDMPVQDSASLGPTVLSSPNEQSQVDSSPPPAVAEIQTREEPAPASGAASDCSSDFSPEGATYSNLGEICSFYLF